MRLPSVLALVLVTAACGPSLRDKADSAFARGDYRAAAELYSQLLTKSPNNPALLAKRTEARHGVLGQLFMANQTARRNNDRALAIKHLGALLAQRDAWEMAIEPRFVQALTAEVGMAGQDIAIDVDHATNTSGPLSGERTLGTHGDLLAHTDFGDRGARIHARVVEVGRMTCLRLAADTQLPTASTGPYWRWVIDRYCTHWGEPGRAGTIELANLKNALTVDGDVDGQVELETAALREALATAFRASAWYSPAATTPAIARVSGQVAIAFSQRPVTLHATWDEEVPYTDYETTQESYEEPYTDTESYSEQVPYTDTETRTESCGVPCSRDSDGGICVPQTCTKTETVTKYRTEWKTRTVTKYRTAWRTVTNPVTRYRTVSHPYSYGATEIAGRYDSALRVTLRETGELAGVVSVADLADSATGIEHDVTFAPAGIAPSRANLPTRERVIERERLRLQASLVQALDRRYAQRYCAATTYDREAAAACVYLDHATAPAPVHAALQTVFGGDEPLLGVVLARESPSHAVAAGKNNR
jgi:hypothetical protein